MTKKKHQEPEAETIDTAPHHDELAANTAAAEMSALPPDGEPVAIDTAPVLFDPGDTGALPPHLRESVTREVRDLFAKAEALLIVLEKRADPRFARARIKLGETVGALR